MLAILPKGYETQMIFGVEKETAIFLFSVVLGAVMGVFYELFRVARRVIKHNAAAVFIEDFLYTVACGCCYYVFVTAIAWGQLRGFVFFGIVLGMLLERLAVGNLVTAVISAVLRTVCSKLLLPPIAVIVRIATKAGRKFVQSSKSFLKRSKLEEKCLKEDENLVYNE